MINQGQSIMRLSSFEPAFAVGLNGRSDAVRRFMTLIVDEPSSKLRGGMSYVCRATTTIGDVLALKRPRDLSSGLDPQARELMVRAQHQAFFEEYRNQLAVAHLKGFPKLYGYASVGGEPAILMEWVEGITLRDAAPLLPREDGGVRGTTVAELGCALLEVLASIDRLNEQLVHRDISPRNIMLRTNTHTIAQQVESRRFDVVLIDFGSSITPYPDGSSFTMRADIWRNGTPEYAPPEMLTRDIANVETLRSSSAIDVYALCSVLYELYCGRTPFEMARRHGASPYRVKTEVPLRELEPRSARDRELTEAIMSGIRGFQSKRPTPAELLERMRAWRSNA